MVRLPQSEYENYEDEATGTHCMTNASTCIRAQLSTQLHGEMLIDNLLLFIFNVAKATLYFFWLDFFRQECIFLSAWQRARFALPRNHFKWGTTHSWQGRLSESKPRKNILASGSIHDCIDSFKPLCSQPSGLNILLSLAQKHRCANYCPVRRAVKLIIFLNLFYNYFFEGQTLKRFAPTWHLKMVKVTDLGTDGLMCCGICHDFWAYSTWMPGPQVFAHLSEIMKGKQDAFCLLHLAMVKSWRGAKFSNRDGGGGVLYRYHPPEQGPPTWSEYGYSSGNSKSYGSHM